MPKIKDISGQTYGNLTVLRLHHFDAPISYWLCKCSCGNDRVVAVSNIKKSKGGTCYCHRTYTGLKDLKLHQRGYKKKPKGSSYCRTKEYVIWAHIKNRCYNKNASDFHRYGGRGIEVCERWLKSFEDFLFDIGFAPTPKHSLDRKDNNGNYEPGNVRWATPTEQANNRRSSVLIEYNNQSKPLRFWCAELNLSYELVRYRLYLGWSIEDAFFRLPRHRGPRQ